MSKIPGTITKAGGKASSKAKISSKDFYKEVMEDAAIKESNQINPPSQPQQNVNFETVVEENNSVPQPNSPAHYKQQIEALKAKQQQLQDQLNKNNSADPSINDEESDSKAAEAMEENKEKNEQIQRNNANRTKELQELRSRITEEKSKVKQEAEEKIRDLQTNPPKYPFFSGNAFFFLIAGADFLASAMPVVGFAFQPVIFIVAMVGWLIPCILLKSPFSIIPIFFFYLVDYGTSLIAASILAPILGAVLDLVPELGSRMVGFAPNQIIKRAEDRVAENKIQSIQDKLRIKMRRISEGYKRETKRINNLYNNVKLRMPSFNEGDLLKEANTLLLFIMAGFLAWYSIIGLDPLSINIIQLLFTGIFMIIAFFIQKMGLILDE